MDIQFVEKDKQIENTQKLADQAQQLHAMAEKKYSYWNIKKKFLKNKIKDFFRGCLDNNKRHTIVYLLFSSLLLYCIKNITFI